MPARAPRRATPSGRSATRAHFRCCRSWPAAILTPSCATRPRSPYAACSARFTIDSMRAVPGSSGGTPAAAGSSIRPPGPTAKLVATALAAGAALWAGGCTSKQPQPSTYFDRQIAPILELSCARTNTGAGCHVADAKGNAFGNLDLTTFAGVDRRRDLLLDYGPYLQPSLLVKNVPPFHVDLVLWDGTKAGVTTDIRHAGGPIFDPTASAYQA